MKLKDKKINNLSETINKLNSELLEERNKYISLLSKNENLTKQISNLNNKYEELENINKALNYQLNEQNIIYTLKFILIFFS